MDTDTLREKFIRSKEALSRLGDDTAQLILTRVQDLQESRDYLDTLIKEKEAVYTQITEQEAKIASLQEEIRNQANLKEELIRKQERLIEELQAKKVKIEEFQIELEDFTEKSQAVSNEIDNLKTITSQTRDKIASLTQANLDLENQLKTEIDSKEAENQQLKTELENLKTNNAVISFLLEESAEDIPEVDILATVMKLGQSTKDQLKQHLEGQISPVIITRTLGRMAEKNLLKYDESNDRISML